MEDRDFVVRAKSGDKQAFGELVRRHERRLRGFAACYVQSREDVLEIVQDAFVNAFEHLAGFDVDREFGPWLRVVCRNRIRNFYRDNARARAAGVTLLDEAIEEQVAAQAPEAAPSEDAAHRITALRVCIGKLRGTQQQLVELRYRQGVTVLAIAEKLKRSPTAVSMRLVRLRDALRKCMIRALRTDKK